MIFINFDNTYSTLPRKKSEASEKSAASEKYEESDNKVRRVDPGVVALICHHTIGTKAH